MTYKLYVTRSLDNIPEHMRSVVNLREMMNFIDTSSAVDIIGEVGRVASRLIGDVFTNPNRNGLTFDIETLAQVTRAPDRVGDLIGSLHTEEYLARQKMAQEWMTKVMKPAFMKRLDILCIPLLTVIPPEGWEMRMDRERYVIAEGTRVNVRMGIDLKTTREAAIGRFLLNRAQHKLNQQGSKAVMDRQVLQTDMYLFTNHCKNLPLDTEPPTPYYFVAEWAEEMLQSIRDWMLSGEAKIPHVITKLSPEQAFSESIKWHLQLERKKQREAEEKLASMDMGVRELIGSITMDGIRDYQTDRLALYKNRKEVLTVHNLMDSTALQYESVWQHHCVDTYWFRVANCECIILHVDDTQGGRWTVEVGGDSIETPLGSTRLLTTVRQIKGPANQAPPAYVRIGVEFWLKYVNMFIYSDKVNLGDKTLWRYPFKDYAAASGTLLASGFLGTLMQKNSEARFNGHEHVVEIECTVAERLPFSGRSTNDPTTKYRIVPSGLGEDDSVSGQIEPST